MKHILSLVFALCSISIAHGQSRSDIFDKEVKVTYLGIDLSNARLIGDRERYGSESDIRRLMEGWNNIFLKEPDKFHVARALGRKAVDNAIEVTDEVNQQLDILSLYTDDANSFEHTTLADVEKTIASYNFSGLSGIGFIFIVDSFSKPKGKASVWATFVNLNSNEILLTERITGSPGGSGLRNYWANAMYDVLQRIQKKEFVKWKKLYSNSPQ